MDRELVQLRDKVARLEARIEQLEQKMGIRPQSPPQPIRPTPPPQHRPAHQPPAMQKPSPPVRPARESWEQKIGGTWLNRLGIIALLFGLAFFLKFAFDNNWINEYGRIAIGYVIGAVLMGIGFWYRGKGRLPKFGSALGGAAIGAWFISTWAGHSYYDIFPTVAAFAVMVGITVIAVGLALKWNSAAIAGIGLLGGYLTPILIYGNGTHTTLFVYLFILNIGALAVLVKKNWNALSFISLGFTFILYAVALLGLYEPKLLTSFMVYLTAFHLLFAVQGVVVNLVHRRAGPPALGISLISGCFYVLFSALLLYSGHRAGLAMLLFAWGMFYLLQMLAIQRWRPQDKNLVMVLLSLGLAYVTLAVPIWLSSTWITMAWTVQSAVLLALGLKTDQPRYRGWGQVILGLSFLHLTTTDLGLLTPVDWLLRDGYTLPWQGRFPATLLLVLVLLGTAYLYSRDSKIEKRIVPWLIIPASLLALFFTLSEWTRWFYYLSSYFWDHPWIHYWGSAWTLTMAAYIALFLGIFWRWQFKPLRRLIGILLPAAMAWSMLIDLNIFTRGEYLSPWLGRLPGALLLAGLAFAAAWLFKQEGTSKKGLNFLVIFANVLLLVAVLKETDRYYFSHQEHFLASWQVYRNTAWSAAMSCHGFGLVALGIWKKAATLRRLGISLLLLVVAKITLVDLTGLETIWRILVFMGTGIILIFASWLYQRYVPTGKEKTM